MTTAALDTSTAGTQPPDSDLVRAALTGDAGAFERLVRRHYRAAYATALALSLDAMDAEDVCQDAFVKALERLGECRDPSRFAPWLLQIVRRRAHNQRAWRRVRAGPALDDGVAVAAASRDAPAPASLDRAELRVRLLGALAGLNERQREVVLLHDLEDWGHREIADSLGISEVMSRQVLFTARRALRASLGPGLLKEYSHDR